MLAPADLMQPIGDLSPDLFPVLPGEGYASAAEKLEALLYAWADQAEAALPFGYAGTDYSAVALAQTDYVYWKAKSAAYARLLATPSQNAVEGKGSFSFSGGQIAALGQQAEAHRVAWQTATGTPAPAATYATLRTLR